MDPRPCGRPLRGPDLPEHPQAFFRGRMDVRPGKFYSHRSAIKRERHLHPALPTMGGRQEWLSGNKNSTGISIESSTRLMDLQLEGSNIVALQNDGTQGC